MPRLMPRTSADSATERPSYLEELEGLAHRWREAQEVAAEGGLGSLLVQRLVGSRCARRLLGVLDRVRPQVLAVPAAARIDHQPPGDGVRPGQHRRAAREMVARAVDLQKCLLHDVLCGGVALQLPRREAEEPGSERVVQRGESSDVAVGVALHRLIGEGLRAGLPETLLSGHAHHGSGQTCRNAFSGDPGSALMLFGN